MIDAALSDALPPAARSYIAPAWRTPPIDWFELLTRSGRPLIILAGALVALAGAILCWAVAVRFALGLSMPDLSQLAQVAIALVPSLLPIIIGQISRHRERMAGQA